MIYHIKEDIMTDTFFMFVYIQNPSSLSLGFSALETPAQAPQSFSFTSPLPKPVVSNSSSLTAPPLAVAKPPAVLSEKVLFFLH